MSCLLLSKRSKSFTPLFITLFLFSCFTLGIFKVNNVYAFDIFEFDRHKISNSLDKLPIDELTNQLLPDRENWQELLLVDLHSQIDIPYVSVFEFLKEQEELEGIFQVFEQLPAPVITIATPLQGSNADFLAVASATTWANQTLYVSEIAIEYLASHLGASFGLSTSGGLGLSAGIGGTAGLGATAGVGIATGVGVTSGVGADIGLNVGTGSSISVGAGASLGLPITLNDIVTNAFNALRPRFWRVNTLSGDSLKTISPILIAIGNPNQNPQTARLNDDLPIYFDKADGSNEWSLIQRRNNTRYEGHIGIISLSSRVALPEVDFKDGLLGADLVTMVIAASDDQGMEAIARVLQPNEMGETSGELDLMVAYLRGLLVSGMNITGKLDRLRYFTDLSTKTWSKTESPFSFLPQRVFERNENRFLAQINESKAGKFLQGLAEKIKIKERIANSWVASSAMAPDMLSGQALYTGNNTGIVDNETVSATDTKHDRRYLLSYPHGLSLLVFADDEGVPQSIQLVAN